MTDQQASQGNWQPVHEPGQQQINRNLLCRIDPQRLLLEFVRRKRKTIVDLLEYLDIETLERIVRAHKAGVLEYAKEGEQSRPARKPEVSTSKTTVP